MPRLVSAVLARNEADRWLRPTLERLREVSDHVLVLDDQSTDATPDIARELGCEVVTRMGQNPMWGEEAPARAELWDLGAERAGDGWLLIADADMILRGDPRPYCLSQAVTAWAFTLRDMWSETHYRVDGYWQGHVYHRPWMYRPAALTDTPVWPKRGLHTGHAPANFPYIIGSTDDLYWLHLAYSDKTHRLAKRQAYLRNAAQLTPFEIAHAESITDADQ